MATNSKQASVPAWKTLIVILSLLFLWPLGLIFMIIWMKWPVWVKIVVPIVTAFIALIVFSIVSAFLLVLINPQGKVEIARMSACTSRCQNSSDTTCVQTCMDSYKISPVPSK